MNISDQSCLLNIKAKQNATQETLSKTHQKKAISRIKIRMQM